VLVVAAGAVVLVRHLGRARRSSSDA